MNDGGSAFPTHLEDQFIPIPGGGMGRAKDYGWEGQPGMTLLDYMAGKVLEGLYASGEWKGDPYQFAKFSVEEAYAVAKLAIEERARRYAAAKEATDAKA